MSLVTQVSLSDLFQKEFDNGPRARRNEIGSSPWRFFTRRTSLPFSLSLSQERGRLSGERLGLLKMLARSVSFSSRRGQRRRDVTKLPIRQIESDSTVSDGGFEKRRCSSRRLSLAVSSPRTLRTRGDGHSASLGLATNRDDVYYRRDYARTHAHTHTHTQSTDGEIDGTVT